MTAKRVLISIDERLLARIDQRVQRLGLTRSGYLAQLAGTDLEGRGAAGETKLGPIDELFNEK